MTTALRLLFLSDTHLGYDLPFRPLIQRRRRGTEFFEVYRKVLRAAVNWKVDVVIHGGDLFYRSRVLRPLVEMAFDPLKKVADSGILVFILPGNHERGRIPHSELTFHPNLHVFTRPQTFQQRVKGVSLAISGFPFVRQNVRDRFRGILAQTRWKSPGADCRLLCIHHAVEGAVVGPSGYTFRYGRDVIRTSDIPRGFSAVLAGHIHRHQILYRGLDGHPLSAPVFYAGSTVRVSFAERREEKGYLLLDLFLGRGPNPGMVRCAFYPLPSRPMAVVTLRPGRMDKRGLTMALHRAFEAVPDDAVVNIKILGEISDIQASVFSAGALRALLPSTINFSVSLPEKNR